MPQKGVEALLVFLVTWVVVAWLPLVAIGLYSWVRSGFEGPDDGTARATLSSAGERLLCGLGGGASLVVCLIWMWQSVALPQLDRSDTEEAARDPLGAALDSLWVDTQAPAAPTTKRNRFQGLTLEGEDKTHRDVRATRDPLEVAVAELGLEMESLTLTEAISAGKVEVTSIHGTSSNYGTTLNIRSLWDELLEVTIPLGATIAPTILRGTVQRMVVTREQGTVLTQEQEKAWLVDTYCLDPDKEPPSADAYPVPDGWELAPSTPEVRAFLGTLLEVIDDVALNVQPADNGTFSYNEGSLTDGQLTLATCVSWSNGHRYSVADLGSNLGLQVAIWVVSAGLRESALDEMAHEYRWWEGETPRDVRECCNAFLDAGGVARRLR